MTTQCAGFALILAAGRGTRMRSQLAKVLHPLLGLPMVAHPVRAAQQAGLDVILVVNHQEQAVRSAMADQGVRFVRQTRTRGTGDAVAEGLAALPDTGTVIVMAGDAPLLRSETLSRLLEAHRDNLVTVLTAQMADPAAYGRLVRGPDGRPLRIVEAAEASPEILAITEINTGAYAFDIAYLREVLPGLKPHPPKGEIYLTDVLELAAQAGRASAMVHDLAHEVLGVNDRWALGEARRYLQQRINRRHALAGVTFEDPDTTWVDRDVQLGTDIVLGPGVILRGDTVVEDNVEIGAYCVVSSSRIASGAQLLSHSLCDEAVVSAGARVGPFARLRPGAEIGTTARIGNFVEVKKSRFGAGAKANHLAYIGDTDVGAGANIGAGTITCNYDGFRKSRTVIGEGAFIGSNSALVAPVEVGAGAIVGAGGVVVEAVPPDAIAIARGRQVNREGAAARFRERAQNPKATPRSTERS